MAKTRVADVRSLVSGFGKLTSLASLSRTRALLRARSARGWAFDIALLYAILSMTLGGMLDLSPVHHDLAAQVVFGGSPWWDYPWVDLVAPGMFLTLPFIPFVAMLIVSAGVGMGGAAALVLLVPRMCAGHATEGTASTVRASAAAAPAITGLATMGACCCTSCAGAAGVAVVAAASGADLATILQSNWYVSLFQVGVVGFCLVASERALRTAPEACPPPPVNHRNFVLGTLLRVSLLLAGITWSLAMFVEWGEVSPASASAATWYHWIFEHQLLALTAIAAGMFPQEFATWVRRAARRLDGVALRVGLLAAGITWGIGVPPELAELGLGGFLNEVLGVLGVPSSWGAIPPDATLGPALLFHWAFQHLLLGGFAILLATAPLPALLPLLWTCGTEVQAAGRSVSSP